MLASAWHGHELEPELHTHTVAAGAGAAGAGAGAAAASVLHFDLNVVELFDYDVVGDYHGRYFVSVVSADFRTVISHFSLCLHLAPAKLIYSASPFHSQRST